MSIAATDTVPEAVEFLTERGFGAAVVIDDAGHAIGVVTKTDVLMHTRRRMPGLEPDDTPVTEVMTPAVFSVARRRRRARWWSNSWKSASTTCS